MRLIDADQLIEEGWRLEIHGVSNKIVGIMSIADVPTAYDVSKVVAELKKEIERAEKEMEECTFKGFPYYDTQHGYAKAMYKAIEIVKKVVRYE